MNAKRSGFALPLTILVMLALASVAGVAAYTTMSTTLVSNAYERDERLGRYADEAIEHARATLNGRPSLYPNTGYATLEEDAEVLDANGDAVPGMTRSVYAGPVGITSGQFGVHGAVIAVTRDAGGAVAVRRGGLVQESFAKFAYFTHIEGTIVFGGGDQIFGPVHSNDDIEINQSSGSNPSATFFGPVTTGGRVENWQDASFREGFHENAATIPLPDFAELDDLEVQATAGGTAFDAVSVSAEGRARMRIEFIAIDINGDGDNTDANEGFIRVYESSDEDWVVGMDGIDGDMRDSKNCGHWHTDGQFYDADGHSSSGSDDWRDALASSRRACYLGGAIELTDSVFVASNSDGGWIRRGTAPAFLNFRDDAEYLFPVTREGNPAFKGVIHVDGDVAISGTLRGRVTVAATGDIVIVDDMVYSINPSVGSCEDILGLFAGGDVVMAYTPLLAPWQPRYGYDYETFDDTSDEFVHGFVLTLNNFTVEAYNNGPTEDEWCQNTRWGRGCLYLTGGIIQRTRGAVGTTGRTGYIKRYSYDACGQRQPPPYFPTTGRFVRGSYHEIDPVGFDVGDYFDMITAGS